MCECRYDVRRLLETVSGVGISQIHEVGDRHQNLFNFPWTDAKVYQTFQQLYLPRAEHVVREDEVFLG